MKYLQTYRLHPTSEQAAFIRERFALAAYAYNWGLQETERVWDLEQRHLSMFDIKDLFRHHVNYELHRTCSREEMESLVHLASAYTSYFNRWTEKPRIKDAKDANSFTVRARELSFNYDLQTVRIKKGCYVRCNLYRQVHGVPTTATVKEVRPGVFNLVLLTEEIGPAPTGDTADVVGIDLGLKTFATLSTGEKIDFPEHIWNKHDCRHEQRLQRRVKKRKEGSKNYEKARRQLSRFHERKANQRKDFHYQTAARLTKNYGAIAVEDLHVEDMMTDKKHRIMNRNFSRYGLKQFLYRLEARCIRSGTQFLQIGRYEPTSKTCHVCGYKRKTLDGKVREWTCPECGTHLDRDVNAAINIKTLGLRKKQALPDVGGEVLTVERSESPRCESVKADVKKTERPARSSQEEAEHNISRLADDPERMQTFTASEFSNAIHNIIDPVKASKLSGVSIVEIASIRRQLSIEWRREMMANKFDTMRIKLINGLRETFPPFEQYSISDYRDLLVKRTREWFVTKVIIKEHPYLGAQPNYHNCVLWYLYIQRVIRSLEHITIVK